MASYGIIQCDNEPTLKTVATGAAAKIGNITVRQTPTYSSNSQRSVERFHRTLFGQVKSLREQVTASYNNHMIGNNHPLMPWMIRHAAWLINRYLIHSDGLTSYQRRWERDYKHAICQYVSLEKQYSTEYQQSNLSKEAQHYTKPFG